MKYTYGVPVSLGKGSASPSYLSRYLFSDVDEAKFNMLNYAVVGEGHNWC